MIKDKNIIYKDTEYMEIVKDIISNEAARAGLVHDLFLYDWRKREEGRKGFHAFTHPRASYENAKKIFTPNKIEKDIILKHMWPVTPKFPRYKESFLITYVDKYFACVEKSLSNINITLQTKEI